MCRLIFCPNPGFIQHWEQHVQVVFLEYSQDQQVTCSWSMCSIFCKNSGNIFQHWKNPGFIQQHVQDAVLGRLKTLVTCSWLICSKINENLAKINSIGKILVSSRIGKNVQDLDLDSFHGSKYALRCY